jgi:hypothetical protein
MNVIADRTFAIQELNRLAALEELPQTAEATGKSIVSENGTVWHEVLETEGRILFFVTTSIPTNIEGLNYRERVFTAADENDIKSFDHTLTF